MKWSISSAGVLGAAVLAGAGALLWQAPAQSQIRVTPALQPVGAATGAATTAWFQDTTGGRVIACQTTGTGTGLAVNCATAALP